MSAKIDRTGEVSYTKYGTKAVIVEYKSNKEVTVEFQDEHKYRYCTSYINFKNGNLTNPYENRANKDFVGFVGNGKFNSVNAKDAYYKWRAMIRRCYCADYESIINKDIASYKDCTLCDDWLCFQNFAKWYYDHYYECDETLCIDKDILVHGNKEYAPDKCLLVPNKINLMLIKETTSRGNLPMGVKLNKRNGMYIASLKKDGKCQHIGTFVDKYMAFNAYKVAKENHIKEVANQYKTILPENVYNALYKYEILITD